MYHPIPCIFGDAMKALNLSSIYMVLTGTSEIALKERSVCQCPGCPSYPPCGNDQAAMVFCFSTKIRCVTRERGCICSTCPVYGKYDLKGDYFCIKGAAKR